MRHSMSVPFKRESALSKAVFVLTLVGCIAAALLVAAAALVSFKTGQPMSPGAMWLAAVIAIPSCAGLLAILPKAGT